MTLKGDPPRPKNMCFAFFPVYLEDTGEWVWLEWVYYHSYLAMKDEFTLTGWLRQYCREDPIKIQRDFIKNTLAKHDSLMRTIREERIRNNERTETN